MVVEVVEGLVGQPAVAHHARADGRGPVPGLALPPGGLAALLAHDVPPPLGARVLEPHLEDPLRQAGLLGQLLEVLGVGVLVDGEVGLHGAELVVLEGGPHPLRPLGLVAVAGGGGRHRGVVGEGLHRRGQLALLQHLCKRTTVRWGCERGGGSQYRQI